jgi:hypothetical protein
VGYLVGPVAEENAMIGHRLGAAVILILVSGAAFAQEAGSNGPGGLAPRDVSGKRLLDSNGATLGRIESATADEATVRTPDGKHVAVAMAKLSLGTGPHTVIEQGESDADKLNSVEADRVAK